MRNFCRVVTSFCTNCGKKLNAATSPFAQDNPAPGDATVCIKCNHIMIFDENMRLRNPTDEEFDEIAGDEEILAIQLGRRMIRVSHI
jgi:hypothetical protein